MQAKNNRRSGRALSHLDARGRAKMVNVGDKPLTKRRATAEGFIRLSRRTLAAILAQRIVKGEVLSAARLAGIMAAKKTGGLIPLCHPLPLEAVEVDFELPAVSDDGDASARVEIRITATASITAKTGVEMEALTAVAVAGLTIYDMCKAIDKQMTIDRIRLIAKSGGRSDFVAT